MQTSDLCNLLCKKSEITPLVSWNTVLTDDKLFIFIKMNDLKLYF